MTVTALAETYVMVGEYEAAIDQLDYMLSIPSRISVPLLRIDPLYDPLRDHPLARNAAQYFEMIVAIRHEPSGCRVWIEMKDPWRSTGLASPQSNAS